MTISIIFQAVILIQKLRFIKNKIESLNMNIKDLGVPWAMLHWQLIPQKSVGA